MIRKTISLTLVALVALAAVSLAGDGEGKWLDMKNCDMCKNLSSHEGMLEAMTWEQYPITNGIVSITSVKPEFLKQYRAAHESMGATIARLQAGEQLHLCGSCTALGMCMMKGQPAQDYVETMTGDVWIVTSDKPDVVAELQGWVKKNQEAMKNM